jgi:hypothetical protein
MSVQIRIPRHFCNPARMRLKNALPSANPTKPQTPCRDMPGIIAGPKGEILISIYGRKMSKNHCHSDDVCRRCEAALAAVPPVANRFLSLSTALLCVQAGLRLRAMEDQEADVGVHHPSTRLTFVLDLVVGPEMPLAVQLTAPERVVVACISRPDLTRIVCTALSRNPSVLHLDVFACRALLRVTVGVCWPRLPYHPRCRRLEGLLLTVGHMVGSRSGSRRVDICSVAIARHGVVVRPLVRVIEVSKRVHRAIEAVIVVAAIAV